MRDRRQLRIIQLLFIASSIWCKAEARIVINEVMYHPPADRDELQYIELLNTGKQSVDLTGWSFDKGVSFNFPRGSALASGAYAIICRDAKAFAAYYTNRVNRLGQFSGKLSRSGERLELLNARAAVEDSVKFADHAPWPTAPDGHGSSLERICPDGESSDPANWMGSTLPKKRVPAGTPGGPNDTFSAIPPPQVSDVEFGACVPFEPLKITATVSDPESVTKVALLYRVVTTQGAELELPMERQSGTAQTGSYAALIPAQTNGTLVRFRIRAFNQKGGERIAPPATELRPTYSAFFQLNTNSSAIPFGFVLRTGLTERSPGFRRAFDPITNAEPTLGTAAFVYMPPHSSEVLLFDHVRNPPRSGGFKIHFQKDRSLHGMSVANIIFEGSPRYALAEPLAYELYRIADVPAERTEHIRIWNNGRLVGYHLLIEQPNEQFLHRAGRKENGHLYKLLWYGRNIIEQHEKKTHIREGHKDLLDLVTALDKSTGNNQWQVIQKSFNVDEVASYFAASLCVENWDGFHNNYFTYHDTQGSGKWEIIPWDLDKTWGDYDGSPRNYDWCEMPLTFGMAGDVSPPADPRSRHNHEGQFGGVNWWRAGGYFSQPLLANPQFRNIFLKRLRSICETKFTPERFNPLIDELSRKLEPEVSIRAAARGQPAEPALAQFHSNIQSFRYQVEHRRKFILEQLQKEH